jgi:hypothetical protein
MDNPLFQGILPDEPAWTASRPSSTRAGAVHDVADAEEGRDLDEGFRWHRIRRLPKKG